MAKMALKSSKKISTMKISKIKLNYGDGFIKIKVIKIRLQRKGANIQSLYRINSQGWLFNLLFNLLFNRACFEA
jgi:hypothetical protein